jgi:transposase InsO family protein
MTKNKVWQTDITYFQVGERFYYITFIVDIYTKVIKGYKVSEHLFAEANIDALQMALRREKNVEGLIHHSDRGSQFTDSHYKKILKDKGIKMSMGLAAWENAYAERVNGIIKNEYLNRKTIKNFKTLTLEVTKAVNHYNKERIHNHLPNRNTPMQFENELIHLDTQNRPKVIVYAKGKSKISTASSSADFYPETEPQDHVCPMVNS